MTLRQFVEVGTVGTYAEREALETCLLKAWADGAEHGIPLNESDADCDPGLWELAFEYFVKWGLLQP